MKFNMQILQSTFRASTICFVLIESSGRYKCYIKSVRGFSVEADIKETTSFGSKLVYEEAKSFFPNEFETYKITTENYG